MNFDFNEEQRMLRDSVRDFLGGSWSMARVRALTGGDGSDAVLWTGLAELGLPGLLVPEDCGGMGLSFLDFVLVVEEFGRHLVPRLAVETLAFSDAVARYGTQEQRARLLESVVMGTTTAALAYLEPGAGYRAEDTGLLAMQDGNGWRL